MNCLSFSKKFFYPLLFGATILVSSSQSYAFCLFHCHNDDVPAQTALHLNDSESEAQIAADNAALANLQREMVARFTNIETMLKVGRNNDALVEAKKVLDDVRVKTGIDPKIKIVESFLVPTIFPTSSVGIHDLDDQQAELVIRTVSDFRGGLYMDIMNLSKRTTLLYIKAFKAVVQAQGGMTNDDKNKIVNDLVKASLVPMTIEDKKGKKITVFDEDVANEDHTYLFNRELKMFLSSQSDLAVTEASFDQMRASLKEKLLGRPAPAPITADANVLNEAKACMQRAQDLSYGWQTADAVKECFDSSISKIKVYKECLELADMLSYGWQTADARASCYKQFPL